MKDYLHIGPNPPEEECVPISGGTSAMKAECRRYIELLRQCLGDEPEGARLAIKREDHEFGAYYEVVCHYDTELPQSVEYAYKCEGEGPTRWSDSPLYGIKQDLAI